MKAALVNRNDQIYLLFRTGGSKKLTIEETRNFLLTYTIDKFYPKEDDCFFNDNVFNNIENIKGEVLAVIDDDFKLTFYSSDFFVKIMTLNTSFITTKEYAEKYNKSINLIGKLILQDRIPGVIKQGGRYLIPADAPFPSDGRLNKKK